MDPNSKVGIWKWHRNVSTLPVTIVNKDHTNREEAEVDAAASVEAEVDVVVDAEEAVAIGVDTVVEVGDGVVIILIIKKKSHHLFEFIISAVKCSTI